MTTRRLTRSRTYPVVPQEAFDRLIAMPLTELFSRRYGPLPPIREVRDQSGAWDGPGQTRTIVLADGTTMVETLTLVDRPRSFGYRISELRGPLKALASGIEGEWRVEPAGTGSRVTWTWDVEAASRASSFALPVLARLWSGYARQALEELEHALV